MIPYPCCEWCTVLKNGQFAALKKGHILGKNNNLKPQNHNFGHFIRKMVKIHKIGDFACKNIIKI